MEVKNTKPLPLKIENRLSELVEMKEFTLEDCDECRPGYWTARDDWHGILVRCYDRANARIAARAAAPVGTP